MRLTITDFQSIAKADLQLEGLTALVGPSDRGKSAVVRALQGVFFNLPGDYFVRTGAQTVRVYVEWLSDASSCTVLWEKGGGKNQFTIGGDLYDKVGSKAPEAMRLLGFRDELIGARMTEDGSLEGGKWMRPQIAEQFDEIFLLRESGTFINEVIVKLSRLGVLQRASRQCALDLRSTKSLLRTRQADLDAATVAAEKLAQAPLLRARLDALTALDGEIEEKQQRLKKLEELVIRRVRVRSRLVYPVPAIAPDRTEAAHGALADYQQLLAAREGMARRAALAKLPKALPASKVALGGPAHLALSASVHRWQELGQYVGLRLMRQIAVNQAESVQLAASVAWQSAQARLDRFRAETPVCPLCLQPWAEAHTHREALA